MAVLEAAAVGLPILVRDLPAYRGWLKHGGNCLIAKDDSELEKYLRELVGNPALRSKLGNGAKALAEKESLLVLANKLKNILNSII